MYTWKTFSPEELMAIRANKYVKSATENMIRYTVAFKEEFWRRYTEEGQSPTKIMSDMGFDVDVLGEKRIAGIVQHLRIHANNGEGFSDVRKTPATQAINAENMTPSRALLRVQNKVAYLEQEVEFIKKNIIADNAARRKK